MTLVSTSLIETPGAVDFVTHI